VGKIGYKERVIKKGKLDMLMNVKNNDVWNVNECMEEFDVCKDDIKENGVYKFLMGSRGILEEVEYLGDVDEVVVKSKEECLEENREWYKDYLEDGEMNEDDLVEINNEYYHLDMMVGCRMNKKKYLVNGWTEEDSDCFVRVVM